MGENVRDCERLGQKGGGSGREGGGTRGGSGKLGVASKTGQCMLILSNRGVP